MQGASTNQRVNIPHGGSITRIDWSIHYVTLYKTESAAILLYGTYVQYSHGIAHVSYWERSLRANGLIPTDRSLRRVRLDAPDHSEALNLLSSTKYILIRQSSARFR